MHLRTPSLLFAIVLSASVSRAALTDYTLLPSAENPVSTLASVKITFPEAKFLGMYGSQLEGVTLTSVSDPSAVYEPCNISYSTFFSSNSQTFSLRRVGDTTASVISEPGQYVLHFPARCFDLCGDWYKHLGYSPEINVTYTIGGSGAGYDRYFDPSSIGIAPAPGPVMEFRDITLSFPVSDEYPTIDIINTDVITLTRKDGAREYVITETLSDGEGKVAVNFRRGDSQYPHPEYIYEPGEYTVSIPAGIFRLTSTDIVNNAMSLKYTVTGTNAASQSLSRYTLTPAPATVERIETIILEYPDLDGKLSFPDGLTDITSYLDGRITLKRLNTDPDLCSVYIPYSARLLADNRIELRFRNRVATSSNPGPETITRLGDYQLTVLPNTFKLKSDPFAFNARIEAYYTVSRVIPANTMSVYDLSPADGEQLGAITGSAIIFPEATAGLDFPIDRTRITLTNINDPADTYEARNLMLQANKLSWGWNRPDFTYDERLTITREGTYRLRIAAGTMRDYDNRGNVNPEITALLHVSPDNAFNYALSPEADRAYPSLTSVSLTATGGATDMHPTGTADAPAVFREAAGVSYTLDCTADCSFGLPANLPDGTYTLSIPAGYFEQTNRRGRKVTNPAISAIYRIMRPGHFEPSLVPASGSTVSGLKVISVTPTGGSLHSFGTDSSAGTPTLSGPGISLNLNPTVSRYSVSFILDENIALPAGDYTLNIPSGYITVVDGNGLDTSLDAVTARYTIARTELPVFDGGIFLLNEGAFGSDFGSLNYLESDLNTIHYRVFSQANEGATPGVTAQYGCIHGDRLYLLGKQTSYNNSASLLTVADAHTLGIDRQTSLTGVAARALCPAGRDRLYIGSADGIYTYDAATHRLGDRIPGTETGSGLYKGQTGDMIRMGRYVFAAVQGLGIRVLDPTDDRLVKTLSLPEISGIFVTGEGRLFASADKSGEPFTEIDPETLALTPVKTAASAVASQWTSWRALPLTAAIRGNRIFYVAEAQTSSVASYDFDSDTFTAGYIRLPAVSGFQMETYGTALSTEPQTGYVVITATGDAANYDRNAILFASPTDGGIISSMTVPLERGYLFPAMAIYPAGDGPAISGGYSFRIPEGESEPLDLAGMTYLSYGNPSLIIYSAESSDPGVCTVTRDANGLYTLAGIAAGSASVTVSADYRGMTARAEIPVTVHDSAGIDDVRADDIPQDVYDLSGRCVLRGATPDRISRLPRGCYIIGGKKKLII